MELQPVYRIYCDQELNLRIKPRNQLKRDGPVALAVPDAPNVTWSMDFALRSFGSCRIDWVMAGHSGC